MQIMIKDDLQHAENDKKITYNTQRKIDDLQHTENDKR